MKKILLIIICLSTYQMRCMDFSNFGRAEDYDSISRHMRVGHVKNVHYQANRSAIEEEFFLQSSKNNVGIIRHLLSVGVSPTIRNKNGDTALLIAIQHNAQEVAELLLQRCADPLQLVEHVPGQLMSLQKYVALYHENFYELITRYIATRYAPSAPEMEDFEESEKAGNRMVLLNTQQNDLSVGSSRFSKISNFVKTHKIASGITMLAVAGLAYKYIQSRNKKKNE